MRMGHGLGNAATATLVCALLASGCATIFPAESDFPDVATTAALPGDATPTEVGAVDAVADTGVGADGGLTGDVLDVLDALDAPTDANLPDADSYPLDTTDAGLFDATVDANVKDAQLVEVWQDTAPACPKAIITVDPNVAKNGVTVGQAIAADGGSSKAYGGASVAKYSWSLTLPKGSSAYITPDAGAPKVEVKADVAGIYIFGLIVFDSAGVASCTQAKVTVVAK
jgi:hypothetical protein